MLNAKASFYGTTTLLLLILLIPGMISPVSYSAYACQQDFKLSISPSTVTLKAGSSIHLYPSGGRGLFVTSLCGLSGSINVGEKCPCINNAPVAVPTRYDLPISPTFATSSTILTVSTNANTPTGTYVLTITGTDVTGGLNDHLTHSASLTVLVT